MILYYFLLTIKHNSSAPFVKGAGVVKKYE